MKETLQEHAMRETQRLGQEIEQDIEPEQLMSDRINYGMSVTQGGKRIDPMSIYKEPEQEPVAWINEHGHIDRGLDAILDPTGWTPLYTAPPQRKPLTHDELSDIWFKQSTDWMEFARAIEAAHGIKGDA